MANDVTVLLDAPHQVAVHDLHMIDVKKKFYALGPHAANDRGHPVQVVALVAGVALHRMRAVAGVEVLHADGHAATLGVRDELPQAAHAIVEPLLAADLAAARVVGIAPLVAAEGDD